MALWGMLSVFGMLVALMIALMLLSRLDRGSAAKEVEDTAASEDQIESGESAEAVPVVAFSDPSGLTADQIAAISVAVITHAEVRKKQGAPVNRVHAPGSRLWASRWVSIGRTSQMNNQRR